MIIDVTHSFDAIYNGIAYGGYKIHLEKGIQEVDDKFGVYLLEKYPQNVSDGSTVVKEKSAVTE